MSMLERFTSIRREISDVERDRPFQEFSDKRVVTEDIVEVRDIAFLYKNIEEVKCATIDKISILTVFDHFQKKKYPWFLMIRNSYEQKLRVIMRIYDSISSYLPNEEEYKNKTEEELEQILEEIIEKYKNSQKNDDQVRYFNILSHFGQTCKHFAKYPVIFLTLPEITTEEEGKFRVRRTIQLLYKKHSYLKDSYKNQIADLKIERINQYDAIFNLKMFDQYLQLELSIDMSLKFLSQQLFKLTQVPAIILIDEYDRPMNTTMRIGKVEYEQMKSIMSSFLTNSLKDNPFITRSYTTGVSRLSKADIFSGPNNLIEYGLENTIFKDSFGFTHKEVKSLINKYYINNPPKINTAQEKAQLDIDLKEIKQKTYYEFKYWYNKYLINDYNLFNPFSVMNCLSTRLQFQCYWANSGNPAILLESFQHITEKKQTLKILQQEIIKFQFDANLDWQGMTMSNSSFLLNFLFQSGYLTSAPSTEDQLLDKQLGYRFFVIPNEEVRKIFYETLFPAFFKMAYCPNSEGSQIQTLVENITQQKFPQLLEEFINNNIEIDLQMKENSYQGLIEAIFRLSKHSRHVSQSEMMIKRKFADAVFIPRNQVDSSIVLHEYKLVHQSSLVQKSLENALWQIFSLGYAEILLKDQSWEKAVIRSMAFLTEKDPTSWKQSINISSLEYVFSREQLQLAANKFSEEQNSKETNKFLRGKTKKIDVENERKKFLDSKEVTNFNDLLGVNCTTYEKGQYRTSNKEKGINWASSKVNNSQRSQFFKEDLINEDKKRQFMSDDDSDEILNEAIQRSLKENVKKIDSNKKEQYEENYEGEQEKSQDHKQKKQQSNREEEEENYFEKEIYDEQSYSKKESKQSNDQNNRKKMRNLDFEEQDETESGNKLQNQELIPQKFYCLPQTNIFIWKKKSNILQEIRDMKHINFNEGYDQISNLYSRPNKLVDLDSLKNYIDDRLQEPERVEFFWNLLPFIAKLALEVEYLDPFPFLTAQREAEVIFTRKQIASLLAGMFLGVLLPQQQNDLPSESSFRKMLAGSLIYTNNSRKIEKISCIVHYFKRIQAATKEQLNEKVSFHRLVFNPQLHNQSNSQNFWKESQKQVSKVIHLKEDSIEDFDETIQVDFSNELIGGGVLDERLEQEEIRFLVSPELIISRLLCPKIQEDEAILIVGSKQFSSYEGYGDTFKFFGDKVDKHIGTNTQGFRKSVVLAIDAINYSQSKDKTAQYCLQAIMRELLKSYVGFECSKQLKSVERESKMRICTGRWGCGVFGGDPQLKFLIQWMSASEAERDMIFCSLNDQELSEIEKVIGLLKNKKVNEVFTMINKYTEQVNNQNNGQTLFQFVENYW